MDSSLRESQRLSAVTAGWTGDTSIARRLLSDSDPSTRASAVAALQRLDDLSIGELQAALDDLDPTVQRRALLVAASMPNHWRTHITLDQSLNSDHDEVVETAAFCAGEFTRVQDSTLDALEQIARSHDEPTCRESAAAALGAIGQLRSLPAILDACADVATVRRRAVLSLAAFDEPAAEEMLISLLADRDWQVRQAAEDLTATD